MTETPAVEQTSYDRVPYKSNPFPQTHPDRLATMATLFGMHPAAVERCRVLELGCASGGNLLPMADQFPESQFLGIDASSRQIADGQELLNRSGLTNVELRCQDILQFASDQQFDFIICHGVYSWVPEPVQQKILDICRQHLSPQGVAYVSYNTYPGWHMKGMIRDIMRYRGQSFDDPRQKLDQARGLLAFLSNSVKGDNNPYGLLLKQEVESIGRKDDSYLLHDHLEEVNDPVYFHQFAERAQQAQLQYLGEADFGAMSMANLPEQVRGMLLSVSRNSLEVEQYMDFLKNRSFRQTLLCHANLTLERTAQPRHLLHLRIASQARPETESPDVRSKQQVKFLSGKGTLTTSDPLVKAALAHLKQIWPASTPFAELAALAQSTARGRPAAVDREVMSAETESLATTFLRCFATATIELRHTAPRFVIQVSERPLASPLARAQALRGPRVTNRLHETVTLDDVQRQILTACNGERSTAELIESLCDAVQEGGMILHHDGRRVTDRDTARRLTGETVPSLLAALTQRALFVG